MVKCFLYLSLLWFDQSLGSSVPATGSASTNVELSVDKHGLVKNDEVIPMNGPEESESEAEKRQKREWADEKKLEKELIEFKKERPSYWSDKEKVVEFDSPTDDPHLTVEYFHELLRNGTVVVVRDFISVWPGLKGMDCSYFAREFPNTKIQKHYSKSGTPWDHLKVLDKKDTDKTDSAAKTEHVVKPRPTGPWKNPHYWAVKEGTNAMDEPDRQSQEMYKRAVEAIPVKLPSFFSNPDRWSKDHIPEWIMKMTLSQSPELWFASDPGSGAQVHIDPHISHTMSIQMSGTKIWRFSVPQARILPLLVVQEDDGDAYKRKWEHEIEITLKTGDVVFFPPMMLHETTSVLDQCAVSLTMQPEIVPATTFWRDLWKRMRFSADAPMIWWKVRTLIEKFGMTENEVVKADRIRSMEREIPAKGEDWIGFVPASFAKWDTDHNGKIGWEDFDLPGAKDEEQNSVEDGVSTQKISVEETSVKVIKVSDRSELRSDLGPELRSNLVMRNLNALQGGPERDEDSTMRNVRPYDFIKFFDLDNNGAIDIDELIDINKSYYRIEKDVVERTPKQLRGFQMPPYQKVDSEAGQSARGKISMNNHRAEQKAYAKKNGFDSKGLQLIPGEALGSQPWDDVRYAFGATVADRLKYGKKKKPASSSQKSSQPAKLSKSEKEGWDEL